jgi:hypothetical protein
LGARLQVFDGCGVRIQLRLSGIDPVPEQPSLEQFSILLEGEHLPEGLYGISHPSIGTQLLRLEPSAAESEKGITANRGYIGRLV